MGAIFQPCAWPPLGTAPVKCIYRSRSRAASRRASHEESVTLGEIDVLCNQPVVRTPSLSSSWSLLTCLMSCVTIPRHVRNCPPSCPVHAVPLSPPSRAVTRGRGNFALVRPTWIKRGGEGETWAAPAGGSCPHALGPAP